jgi:hypothetical protein
MRVPDSPPWVRHSAAIAAVSYRRLMVEFWWAICPSPAHRPAHELVPCEVECHGRHVDAGIGR